MRWGLGAAAAAVLLAAAAARGGAPRVKPRAQGDGMCELEKVDRARTSSRRCLACHDGTVGEGIAFVMPGSDAAMNHPVEIDYGAAAARRPREYVPGSQLPADVPLVQGKVTCTSCHDGRSTEPHQVSNGQRLCTSCHVK